MNFLGVFEAVAWMLGGIMVGALVVAAFVTRPRPPAHPASCLCRGSGRIEWHGVDHGACPGLPEAS